MKILHLDSGREMRGGQWQVLRLTEGLREHTGIEQRLLCRGSLLEQGLGEPLTFGALRQQARWADLIHAHDARTHTWAAMLSKPLVVSRRVAFPIHRGVMSRLKYRRASRFLAVSQFVAGQLRTAGVDPSRISVVPDGAPIPSPPARLEWRSPPRVLALASDDPGKGTDLARAACAEAGLELRLTSDLERDLPEAEIFLYLSESEGLGSALILASLAKRAIVASRVGGIPEVVKDEQTGLLAPNEVSQIAAALTRLATESGLAERLAEGAFERAGREFSVDIMVARTVEAYRSTLAS